MPKKQAPKELIVECMFSGVSHGTERLLYLGEGPTPFDESLETKATTYPCRYGYAWVGKVVEASDGEARREGDSEGKGAGAIVFGFLPHGDRHRVNAEDARLIDRDVPPLRAVLAANLETAINCVWDACISLGDSAVIVGGGEVGALCGFLAMRAGARVVVVESSAPRRVVLSSLGVDARAHVDGAFDVVIEATGNPASLDVAISLAGLEAKIVVASFYGARRASLDLGTAFHRKRLAFVSSQVSRIPSSHAARWSPARRFALVNELLRESALDALIGDPIPVDDAPRAYAALASADPPSRKIVFSY